MHTITNSDSSTTTDTTTTTDQSETEIATITDIASSGSTTVGSNDIGGNYLGVNTNTLTQIESYADSGPSLTLTGASTLTSTQSSSGNGNAYTGNYIFTSSETDAGTDSDSGVAGTRTFSDSGSTSSTTTARDSGNSVNQTDTITSTQTAHSTTTHTDTYTGGGADTQTITASDTLTTTQSTNAATGDYTTTNIDRSSQTADETGSAANTYTLTATVSSNASSTETGNATTGAYTLTTSSTDTDNTTRTGTDTSGNTFAITQSDSSSGTVNTTGNNLVGDYTATAIGTDTLTTNETISGTGNSETLHQVDSGTSTLTNIGNDYTGDFSTTNYETNATTLIQSGYNTSGTYSLNESMSDDPTIIDTGNNINGTQSISQTGSQAYTLTQTNTSGSNNYTLTGTGSNPYTISGSDDADTGDSTRTQTGTDAYTLTQTGAASGSSFSLVLTGSDGYTTDSDLNSQSGAFGTTTTGTGTYTKTGTGAGSGTTSFTSTETGSSRDADVTLTTSGTSRYNLLVGFNNTSDAGNGTAGIGDYSPVGLPVLVGRASVPAGIFSSLGDARFEYCFAARTKIRLADHPPRNIEKMEEQLRLPAVRDTDPEGKPELCHVLKVFRNAPAPIWHVNVAGDTIRTTANHPFYVHGKGWIAAAKLQPGDRLRTFDGGWVAIESVNDSGAIEPVFNLHVENARTYYVQLSGGEAILVHNASDGDTVYAAEGRVKGAAIEQNVLGQNPPAGDRNQATVTRTYKGVAQDGVADLRVNGKFSEVGPASRTGVADKLHQMNGLPVADQDSIYLYKQTNSVPKAGASAEYVKLSPGQTSTLADEISANKSMTSDQIFSRAKELAGGTSSLAEVSDAAAKQGGYLNGVKMGGGAAEVGASAEGATAEEAAGKVGTGGAKSVVAKVLLPLAVYMTIRDAAAAAGINGMDQEPIEDTYYFTDGKGSVFVVQKPGWLMVLGSDKRVYVAGPKKGTTEDITSDEYDAYQRQAEAKYGRYVPGSLFHDAKFIPGTDQTSLPLYDWLHRKVGYIDENGTHEEKPNPLDPYGQNQS